MYLSLPVIFIFSCEFELCLVCFYFSLKDSLWHFLQDKPTSNELSRIFIWEWQFLLYFCQIHYKILGWLSFISILFHVATCSNFQDVFPLSSGFHGFWWEISCLSYWGSFVGELLILFFCQFLSYFFLLTVWL